jgi:2-dehydro-3-deoxygalactonokinase
LKAETEEARGLTRPTDVSQGALIAVDWGTSRLRATLVNSGGETIAEGESDEGIGRIDRAHDAVLARLVVAWPRVPAIVAGMAGSRQGWREAPYVPCPATPTTLAENLLRLETDDGRAIAIVPGLMLRTAERDGDVMRGEETQIVGLIGQHPSFNGTVVLPGTHSKWVRVTDDTIVDFQTFLSGEMFDLLVRHSLLRHSVAEDGYDLVASPAFTLGVERIAKEGLPFLAAIFSVRARQLLDDVDPRDNRAYLSGLVIGGEIAAARAMGHFLSNETICIVGTEALANAYRQAFALLGQDVEIYDGRVLAVGGLIHLANAAGFVEIGRHR